MRRAIIWLSIGLLMVNLMVAGFSQSQAPEIRWIAGGVPDWIIKDFRSPPMISGLPLPPIHHKTRLYRFGIYLRCVWSEVMQCAMFAISSIWSLHRMGVA